jgi:hypothetical protein
MSSSSDGFGWAFGGCLGVLTVAVLIVVLFFAGGKVAEPCSICHGSGNCTLCKGNGQGVLWGPCSVCNGKKRCSSCGGSGWMLKK